MRVDLDFGRSAFPQPDRTTLSVCAAAAESTQRALTCPCPHGCGHRIPPAELLHVDGVNVRCPKCHLDTPYITGKRVMVS